MSQNQKDLSEMAAAQLEHKIFAFSLAWSTRRLARLQASHARKSAEAEAVLDLISDTTPNLILRTADGRELVLRLPTDEMQCLCSTLYGKLANGVREVEEQIVEEALEATRHGDDIEPDDMRPSILALCQPTAVQTLPSGD